MTENSPATEESGRPRKFWHSPWFWGILAGLVLIPAMYLPPMRSLLSFEPPPPPVIAELAEFRLTDSSGQAFGSDELEGRVWVANFFFTRCTSICPRLSAAMASLDRRYQEEGVEGIHLVSFSVDPEYDTPERLTEYGKAFKVDPQRWTMLTGTTDQLREVVVDGFKTAMDRTKSPGGDLIDVAHTGKFVIVDGNRGIRGYYDSDELGLDEIFHRSQHVLNE